MLESCYVCVHLLADGTSWPVNNIVGNIVFADVVDSPCWTWNWWDTSLQETALQLQLQLQFSIIQIYKTANNKSIRVFVISYVYIEGTKSCS